MLETPYITQSSDQLVALIRLTVPRTQIQEVMGPGLAEVKAVLAAQGIPPAGPWFTHHLRMDSSVFDFEICVPVSTPVTAAGRVEPGRLPATRVARTIYRGPYEGLAAAWGEFDAWIVAQGLTPAPDLWECYVTGPETSPNPNDWRTEFHRPLLDPA